MKDLSLLFGVTLDSDLSEALYSTALGMYKCGTIDFKELKYFTELMYVTEEPASILEYYVTQTKKLETAAKWYRAWCSLDCKHGRHAYGEPEFWIQLKIDNKKEESLKRLFKLV